MARTQGLKYTDDDNYKLRHVVLLPCICIHSTLKHVAQLCAFLLSFLVYRAFPELSLPAKALRY